MGVGHGHVVVLAESPERSFTLAKQFHSMLWLASQEGNGSGESGGGSTADISVVVGVGKEANSHVLHLHAAILHARCPVLLAELLQSESTFTSSSPQTGSAHFGSPHPGLLQSDAASLPGTVAPLGGVNAATSMNNVVL